jgi:hypothetical protein
MLFETHLTNVNDQGISSIPDDAGSTRTIQIIEKISRNEGLR